MTFTKYRVLIIGAGGFGREVLNWLISYPTSIQFPLDRWYFGGFLDDNLNALDNFDIEGKILGKPLEFDYQSSDRLICAIANPEAKLPLCRRIESMNGQFINMICDETVYSRQNKLGKGIIMVPGAIITTNVSIGDFVILNMYATIGHDAVIGDGCTLNALTNVTGSVVLDEGVFLGSHACVIPSIKVGAYARIGAGSVVVRDVEPYTTMMGVPAKKIFSQIKKTGD